MATGKINVSADNIFPIIKKFLYSDHEIFLRELISNAVDATNKLKTLSNLGEFSGELGDLSIHVDVDKKKKTIPITSGEIIFLNKIPNLIKNLFKNVNKLGLKIVIIKNSEDKTTD